MGLGIHRAASTLVLLPRMPQAEVGRGACRKAPLDGASSPRGRMGGRTTDGVCRPVATLTAGSFTSPWRELRVWPARFDKGKTCRQVETHVLPRRLRGSGSAPRLSCGWHSFRWPLNHTRELIAAPRRAVGLKLTSAQLSKSPGPRPLVRKASITVAYTRKTCQQYAGPRLRCRSCPSRSCAWHSGAPHESLHTSVLGLWSMLVVQ